MREITMVVGMTNEKTIKNAHLGDSDFFLFVKFKEDGSYEIIKRIENDLPEEKHHGDEAKMKTALNVFKGADVIVGGMMSPNFLKIDKNSQYQPIVSRIHDFDKFLLTLKDKFDEVFDLVQKRRNGERGLGIPMWRG